MSSRVKDELLIVPDDKRYGTRDSGERLLHAEKEPLLIG